MNFSVLMSVYARDSPDYLNQCLNSLVSQSLKADEVILVEDGEVTPEITGVIEAFRLELNIISVQLSKNMGLATALNEGLKICKNNLVARMDSDDIALPERFKKQTDLFTSNPFFEILGGGAQEVNTKGKLGSMRIMPKSHDAIISNMFACPLIHPTIMFRKDTVLSVGGYNPFLKRRQDYDLWFRCAKAGCYFENIPEPLILYRFSSQTHKRQSKKALFKQGMIGFKGNRSLKQPIWKGLACFFPLVRSMLPNYLEHFLYKVSGSFDPRRQGSAK